MYVDQDRNQAAPARLLMAADTSVDPHRLVRLSSQHADGDAPSVSLLVPVDLGSQPSSHSAARAEGLLRVATPLLDAAGIRLEDVALVGEDADFVGQLMRSRGFDALLVCPAHGKEASPVLPLVVRVARLNGLAVADDGRHRAGQASWLRRVVNPLLGSRVFPWGRAP